MVCARERVTNYSAARGGLQQQPAALVVYVSSQAHSSVEKAALLAGFGREIDHGAVRTVSNSLISSSLSALMRLRTTSTSA